jgi:hypothetical protein
MALILFFWVEFSLGRGNSAMIRAHHEWNIIHDRGGQQINIIIVHTDGLPAAGLEINEMIDVAGISLYESGAEIRPIYCAKHWLKIVVRPIPFLQLQFIPYSTYLEPSPLSRTTALVIPPLSLLALEEIDAATGKSSPHFHLGKNRSAAAYTEI